AKYARENDRPGRADCQPGRHDAPAAPRGDGKAEGRSPQALHLRVPGAVQGLQPEVELQQEPRLTRGNHRRARADTPQSEKTQITPEAHAAPGRPRTPVSDPSMRAAGPGTPVWNANVPRLSVTGPGAAVADGALHRAPRLARGNHRRAIGRKPDGARGQMWRV